MVTEEGQILPVNHDPDTVQEFELLIAAPLEARKSFIKALRGDQKSAPCSWLDLENLRCRFYAYRPGVCRRFEVGGKQCLAHRGNIGFVSQT